MNGISDIISDASFTNERIPRNALFRDKKVRILEYLGNGMFRILDNKDNTFRIHRNNLIFIR